MTIVLLIVILWAVCLVAMAALCRAAAAGDRAMRASTGPTHAAWRPPAGAALS